MGEPHGIHRCAQHELVLDLAQQLQFLDEPYLPSEEYTHATPLPLGTNRYLLDEATQGSAPVEWVKDVDAVYWIQPRNTIQM